MEIMSSLFVLLLLVSTSFGEEFEDPNVNHIHYFFYPDPFDYQTRIEVNVSSQSSIGNAGLERQAGAKFIVHGAGGWCNKTDFPLPTLKAYLASQQEPHQSFNLFCIEYTDFTTPGQNLTPPDSVEGSRYTVNLVGARSALFIRNLRELGYLFSWREVHIVGHSMGAHVSSGIGYKLQESINFTGKLGRISAVDSGNPLGFNYDTDLDVLLDPSDADFVDVYHTCQGRIGQSGRIGSVDIYVDGGFSQVACSKDLPPTDQLLENLLGICSHLIVGKYWAISIIQRNLATCQAQSWEAYLEDKNAGVCNNPVAFGDAMGNRANGSYFLSYPVAQLPISPEGGVDFK